MNGFLEVYTAKERKLSPGILPQELVKSRNEGVTARLTNVFV